MLGEEGEWNKKMLREMLIKACGQEVNIAVLQDGQLSEIYLPDEQSGRITGNIYLGQVENVLPGMQAAFVDLGLEKNGFLFVDDAYMAPGCYGGSSRAALAHPPKIHDLVAKGQRVMVQVNKEQSGNKGPRITMHPSLPGRYLVLLPKSPYLAVSRRIVAVEERQRLKDLLQQLLPERMGAIVRTAAQDVDGAQLEADLQQLLATWRQVEAAAAHAAPPCLLYRDSSLLTRVIRDTRAQDIDRIIVEPAAMASLQQVLAQVAPSLQAKVAPSMQEDVFAQYQVYGQMRKALSRKVWLKSGGYLVFDHTEALTVIDVNTGKYVGSESLAATVLTTNLQAVKEIARQLRLRNIGGIVIIDFIDMEQEQDRQHLLAAVEEELSQDRVRVTVAGMTQLGLVELTRKKLGRDLASFLLEDCPHCQGSGRRLRMDGPWQQIWLQEEA